MTPEVTAEVVSAAPVEVAVAVEPAPRGRRRRGRVVAPAGPPRGSAAGAAAGRRPGRGRTPRTHVDAVVLGRFGPQPVEPVI